MYKFMELPDRTEITHSDVREDGTVKVCVERPVEGDFKVEAKSGELIDKAEFRKVDAANPEYVLHVKSNNQSWEKK